jgi:hypothetical protein
MSAATQRSKVQPERNAFGTTVILRGTIAAVTTCESAPNGHGHVVQLAEGETIVLRDSGFNDKTAKIEHDGELYFVFWQDIAPRS